MSSFKSDIKLGALVEEAPEGSPPSPPPPARSPDRLREKITLDSTSSVSKGQPTASPVEGSPATSSDSGLKEVLEVVSADEMTEATPPHVVSTGIDNGKLDDDVKGKSKVDSPNQVPVSANIDKKIDLPDADQIHDRGLRLAQRGFHLDMSSSPEAEPSRPGAFSVAGIGQQNYGDVAPSVPSVVMDVEDLPIAAELAEEVKPVEASKLEDVVVNYRSRKVRIGMFALFLVLTGAIIGGVTGAQKRKEVALGECIVEDASKLGNGECDKGEYNTEKCQWDGGDCLVLNLYPGCALTPKQSSKLGDGNCDGLPWYTPQCGLDAGDCKACLGNTTDTITIQNFGNGVCDQGQFNTAECSWEGGDCLQFNFMYPECRVRSPHWIGNGLCNNVNPYQTVECGWDGGDCFIENYPDCFVSEPDNIGDGGCDLGEYNTEECGWDGGDCLHFNKYPDCTIEHAYSFGNGECDGGDYNTIECGWDGGDCLDFNLKYPNCNVEDPWMMGDDLCDGDEFNILECGWEDGDCKVENTFLWYTYPDCRNGIDPFRIGDGWCDGGKYNSEECGWDGGDCLSFNQYPNCTIDIPGNIGNGECDGTNYNTIECGWDGGDCLDFNRIYPDCRVDHVSFIADGTCDGGEYNTAECGWDGGDCDVENKLLWEMYPDCKGHVDPSRIGDDLCDGGEYNTEKCGWDGDDCHEFNTNHPGCFVEYISWIGDGQCDGGKYDTAECGWDGGDCI